jgi:RimJ/RimL family protein N-acetyltransferase
MDYTIGNIACFGKGLGAKTLEVFIDFFRSSYDSQADTFFIDPDVTNPRARHIYEKAGFKYIDDFIMEGEGVFAGRKTHFLVK